VNLINIKYHGNNDEHNQGMMTKQTMKQDNDEEDNDMLMYCN